MGKEILCVYLAGPITPTSRRNHSVEHLDNIRRGISMGKVLMENGFSVYNPFLDFSYLLEGSAEFFTVSRIRKMDLAWIPRSDAVFLLPGWKRSVGARGEVEAAKKANVPYFENIDDLVAYRDKMREQKEDAK